MPYFYQSRGIAGACLFSFLLVSPVLSAAQETKPNHSDWSLRLGGGVAYGPDYEGSDDYDVQPIPMVDVKYSEWFFFGFPHGLGVNLVRGDNLTAGIALGYGGGRDDEGDLKPLDEVDDGALGRVFADYKLGRVTFTARFSSALSGDNDGEKAELGAKVGGRIGQQWVYSYGPSVEWSSYDWNDALFSLSPSQASRLGVSSYTAGGGLSKVTLGGSLTRIWRGGWSLTLATGVSELLGDAADSPIVDDLGSTIQASGALILGYKF